MDNSKYQLLLDKMCAKFPFAVPTPTIMTEVPSKHLITILNVPSAKISEVKRTTWKLIDAIFGEDEQFFLVHTVGPRRSLERYPEFVRHPKEIQFEPDTRTMDALVQFPSADECPFQTQLDIPKTITFDFSVKLPPMVVGSNVFHYGVDIEDTDA